MKMVEIKAFLANPKHQDPISQCGEHGLVLITKRMEIIKVVQVCLISRININYKENGGM